MASRGLVSQPVDFPVIGRVALGLGLALCGAQLIVLLSKSPSAPLLLVHSDLVLLIALAIYSWMVFPMTAGMAISLFALAVAVWGWAVMRVGLLGEDALALAFLVGVASLQQRRRTLRIQRLSQALADLSEELYVKEQNVRLSQHTHEALQRKLSRYQQLQTIAEHLSRLVNLDAIAQLAVARAFELIGKSDACLLFFVDKDRQELSLYTSKKAPDVPVIRAKQGDQFDRYVLRTHRPLLVNDVRRDFRFSVAGMGERPIGSVIACPVLVGETAEGVLRLDSRQTRAYTQDDLRFLNILLGLIDTAIANARLFAQTQQLALTDGLTGLYRRQPFLDHFAREVARATRSRESLAVLMLDLDDFKRYNDTFGHPAGDLVLKRVADVVRSTVPPDAVCTRYGGEEFAILLPRTPQASGMGLAERLRGLAEHTLHVSGQPSGRPVTVSIGVAVFPGDAQAELELLRLADQRLYQAKRAGKNRVCAT